MNQKEFIVHIVSGKSGVMTERFKMKREAVALLKGERNIQKIAPRVWVIRRSSK